ncbi:hypothetical protein BDR22DRAFT_824019 [Usnea florida]
MSQAQIRNASKLLVDDIQATWLLSKAMLTEGLLYRESADLAHEVAELLYPSESNSNTSQVIKYEKDIVLLRKTIQAKPKSNKLAQVQAKHQPECKKRILRQGPWDEVNDVLPLTSRPALPMPGSRGQEPYNGVDTGEFEKGILYEDGRMDLCKMRPADFGIVFAHPDRMETWYLAGNCIDLADFERLVTAWTPSSSITNIWLKRNPLGPKASTALYDLITKTPKLRTLVLDVIELGDEVVSHLFPLWNTIKVPFC